MAAEDGLRTSLASCLALLGACAAAQAQDLDVSWRTYVNARFGVAVDYPDLFSVRDPEPENGDGQTFETPDGSAKLTVYGSYNVNQQTPQELMQSYKKAGVNYVYAQSGRNWLVLSGSKHGVIGYLRCNLGAPDVVGCFDIEYPASDSARWAPVVERLSHSLRLQPRGD